jgi:hypothetical protein
MECLFSPCTRLFELLENQDDFEACEWEDSEPIKELNLDESTDELLSSEKAFTYADLYAMLENGETVAWLTPHAAVAREEGRGKYCWKSWMIRAASVSVPTVWK